MKFVVVFLVILMQFFVWLVPKTYAATTRVGLGTADGFAVLSGSAISDTPTSVISGDVGLSPGGGASITGLKCSEVTGTIYDNNGGYTGNGGGSTACRTINSGLLTTAQNDLTTAYNDAAGRTVTSTVGTELGGSTLTDGVYNSADGTFGITGTLTLNGQGNADSVFIFKMATTLTTAGSSKVVLTNGAQACNVYWQVGSAATLGTSTSLIGNVLALAAITDDGSSTVNGRLLARTAGAVTLNKTTVTKQTCAEGSAGGPVRPASTTGSKTTSSSDCIASPITTVPIILKSNRVSPTSVFVSWGPYAGIDTFNVRYGLTNGNWLYNTNVTGFSTTINALPQNQPIWIEIAAKNNCAIGTYGESKLIGGPSLPNTGFAPNSCSPMRLVIPAINVNASIGNLGVTSKGAMEVPNNAVDAGWFDLGPRPGERGSAVIAGHFDGENGEAGVFTNLDKLKPGDKLYVQDDKGASTTFTVRESRTYDPGYAEEVFSSSDSSHLNLITCDGAWDGVKKSYTKRLVVFADIAH